MFRERFFTFEILFGNKTLAKISGGGGDKLSKNGKLILCWFFFVRGNDKRSVSNMKHTDKSYDRYLRKVTKRRS